MIKISGGQILRRDGIVLHHVDNPQFFKKLNLNENGQKNRNNRNNVNSEYKKLDIQYFSYEKPKAYCPNKIITHTFHSYLLPPAQFNLASKSSSSFA